MAKTKAFTKFISPNGSDKSEGNLVNQSSPTWVLTFIRWDVRDTLRAVSGAGLSKEIFQVRDPLVVENDCIQVSVNVSKGTLTPSMSATLLETDTNYATSLSPGDFVFVNMLNWEKDARRVASIAKNKTPGAINGPNDGFKGVFKVQGVRKIISIDPNTGTKMVAYKINGFGFTEFNNMIYYNPYLRREDQGSDRDALLFATNIQADYRQLVNPDHAPLCQDIIKFLIQSFVGVGVNDRGALSAAGSPITANTHFYIPAQVGQLLGVKGVKAAKDVYNYLFGLQNYSGAQSQNLAAGMNPSNLSAPSSRFFYTKKPVDGQTALKAEYWNQVNAWSIINQYVNQPLNELYTCFRISPENKVMPTVVLRQVPFTSDVFGKEDPFKNNYSVTRFLEIPRWKVSSALITEVDLGRDESARINFVQYYGQITLSKPGADYSSQTAAKNYVHDINDVARSGLRPYVVVSQFEDLSNTKDASFSRKWAQIIGDALIGGHLKMNGTISCIGLVDPIAVGDNLEYDGTVYHIEDIMHNCSIDVSSGEKTFRTSMKLSNGVSVTDPRSGLAYPEMIHTNAYRDRKDNYENGNQSLPGISEEQDIIGRASNGVAPSQQEINKPDKPYIQPGQKIIPLKKDEDNE